MWDDDARTVADEIRKQFNSLTESDHFIWSATPAAKVIDCVLSLRKRYYAVVVPRVSAFISRRPEIRSCEMLKRLISEYPTPSEFFVAELQMRSAKRAQTLLGVLEYLIWVQDRFDGSTEEERLRAWAQWARPGDYISVCVAGFKLAGFQYLRMLFGANTAKPDIHITRFVSGAIGRTVSEVHALYILERSAELTGVPVKTLDAVIWESRASR